jgi:N-acetylmuramoyl-L-alanine amidase
MGSPHDNPLLMARKIELLVLHCSDSPNGGDVGASDIDRWHRARGFERAIGWRKSQNYGLTSIGYHFVIRCIGQVETGRHVDEIGAHVVGYNQRSIGICLVGKDKWTPPQWMALKQLVTTLSAQFPGAKVVGHRDLSPDLNGDGVIEPVEWIKTCPNFEVKSWLAAGMDPAPEHVLREAVSA